MDFCAYEPLLKGLFDLTLSKFSSCCLKLDHDSFQDLGAEVNCYLRGKLTGLWNKKGSTSLQFTESQIPEKGMQSELEAQRNEFKLNKSSSFSGRCFLRCVVKKSCG